MVRFAHPAQQIVLQDYIDAVADAEARVEHLTGQIAALLPDWTLAPVVDAVQAMRGVGFIVAVTVVAEVGDFQGSVRSSVYDPAGPCWTDRSMDHDEEDRRRHSGRTAEGL